MYRGRLTCGLVKEICKQTAHDSLVTNDKHIFLPFKFHNYWLQSLNKIFIGLGGEEKTEHMKKGKLFEQYMYKEGILLSH